MEWALEHIHKQGKRTRSVLHARHFLHAASWSLSRTPAGDIVHFLHVVPQSHFTSVIQQSEQQEEMLVGQDTFHCFLAQTRSWTGESHGATPACECSDSVLVLQVDQAHNWIQERFTHTCDQVGVSFDSLYSV